MRRRLPRWQGAESSARARKLLQLRTAQSLLRPRHSPACAIKRPTPATPRTNTVIPPHAQSNALLPRRREQIPSFPRMGNQTPCSRDTTNKYRHSRAWAIKRRASATPRTNTVIPAHAQSNAVLPRHHEQIPSFPRTRESIFMATKWFRCKVKMDPCVRRDDGSPAVTFAGMTARSPSRSQGRRLARRHVRRDDGFHGDKMVPMQS